MTQKDFLDGVGNMDSDIVEEFFRMDEELIQKSSRNKPRSSRILTLAACVCLIIGVLVTVPLLIKNHLTPSESPYIPITLDEARYRGTIVGSPLEFVVGSSQNSFGGHSSPPAFEFCISSFIVKATIADCREDIYCMLDVPSDRKPTEYRLILMKTEEIISGENLPQYFLYLLPSYLYTDALHTTLLISMNQIGAENYTLRNLTQSQVEAATVPVFIDYESQPELGNIIAFTDGVFDESLWQTESWIYGYQFARHYLEHPESSRLVVSRGSSMEDAIAEIKSRMKEESGRFGDAYKAPRVISLDIDSDDAKAALEYVKPFENGVFSQRLTGGYNDPTVVFRRYINGCQTEETIEINLENGEVTRSEISYSSEDIGKIENISKRIEDKAREYKESIPTPPHTDPTGKDLASLNLYGWYAKADDKIYGIIKTSWVYYEKAENYITMIYYDDGYTLYDPSTATVREVSRDEIIALFGMRNVYQGQYGGQEFPM